MKIDFDGWTYCQMNDEVVNALMAIMDHHGLAIMEAVESGEQDYLAQALLTIDRELLEGYYLKLSNRNSNA